MEGGLGHSFMSNIRSRRWTVTVNNYVDQDVLDLTTLVPQIVTYLVCGKEVGEQGTPHLQVYLETKKKVTLGSLKKMKGLTRAHIEKANGTAADNLTYCSKEDRDPLVQGEPMRQGTRTDLEEVKEAIDGGSDELAIAEQFWRQWVRYNRAFTRYRSLAVQPRHWVTEVTVLIGPTGCGKTRWAHQMAMDSNEQLWTYCTGDRAWFDGYMGHGVVLFDDFYGAESGINWDMLLKLLDRYPMRVPVKGDFVEWAPRHVVITSNNPVHEWYPRTINQDALWRRITTFIDNDFWE